MFQVLILSAIDKGCGGLMLALDEISYAASLCDGLGVLAKYAERGATAAIKGRRGETHKSCIDKVADVGSRWCIRLVPFGRLGSKYRGRDVLCLLQQRLMLQSLTPVICLRLAYV